MKIENMNGKGILMVRAWNLRVAVVTVMMVFGSGALAQIAGNRQSGNGDGLTPPGTLSFSEEKGLPQMREEEKLTRDVYLFCTIAGHNPYSLTSPTASSVTWMRC
jgi:hypothetical protein